MAYKMSSTKAAAGTMAMIMRTTMLTSGRVVAPYNGPEVVWNGLNGKVGLGLGLGNVSVA